MLNAALASSATVVISPVFMVAKALTTLLAASDLAMIPVDRITGTKKMARNSARPFSF